MSVFGLVIILATAYDVILMQFRSPKSGTLPDYEVHVHMKFAMTL